VKGHEWGYHTQRGIFLRKAEEVMSARQACEGQSNLLEQWRFVQQNRNEIKEFQIYSLPFPPLLSKTKTSCQHRYNCHNILITTMKFMHYIQYTSLVVFPRYADCRREYDSSKKAHTDLLSSGDSDATCKHLFSIVQ
jgi:hypothetical protein